MKLVRRLHQASLYRHDGGAAEARWSLRSSASLARKMHYQGLRDLEPDRPTGSFQFLATGRPASRGGSWDSYGRRLRRLRRPRPSAAAGQGRAAIEDEVAPGAIAGL